MQVKQFEPTNVHYSIKAEIGDSDLIDDVYGKLERIVDAQVSRKVEELLAMKESVVKQPFKPYPKPAPEGEVTIKDEPF